jgi:hypothetical protein
MTTKFSTAARTETTEMAAQTAQSLDEWYWRVRHLWNTRCNEKGADAFKMYVELASIMCNTAACSSAHQEQSADGDTVYVNEEGIDPLLRRLVQNANDLLYLVRKALAGEEII